ncbi:MAG: acyl-CoA dehydrogenase family protein [Rhodospirillales bacterium]
MDFSLTEEQLAIQNMARQFAEDQIGPYALEWEDSGDLPVDVLREAAGLGMAGIYVAEDVGGSGLNRIDAALIFEALAMGDPVVSSFLSIHNMCAWMIDEFGDDRLRTEWVPKLCTMELIASYCLTEPGSGSDAAALKTRAVREGGEYVLNGSKSFISGGGVSDIYIVMCRTGDDSPRGISAIIVPKDTPGLTFGAREKKMGWNAQPTTMVYFENARVPVANLIGDEGTGFKFAMAGLDGGRINIAACSLGAAQAALDKAVAYMLERYTFGKLLAEFQALQFKIADMETELQAARIFLYQSAWKLTNKAPDATKYCAMAKRLVTDIGFNVANEALQLHGGYGYLTEYGIEKTVRDLRVHQILEGTNEIMRVIIAKAMLGKNLV